jgi:AcrR family transcriptional regulator
MKMPAKKQLTKAAQTKATTRKLITIAKKEFSQKGYSGASMERIVKAAGMTRGALYHHFDGKQGLFYAVFCKAQQEIGRRIEKKTEAVSDLWDQLVEGCHGFLEASSDPDLQRIVVIDAPAVLKWETVRFVDSNIEGSGFSLLKECIQELKTNHIIKPLPVDALAHQLNGAMDEAAVWIARSTDTRLALKEAKAVLDELLNALKV